MEYKGFLKEIVQSNKSMVNNSFETISLFQEQSEKMTDFVQAQATWVPKESWVFMNGWMSLYKKGNDSFKDSVNAGFDRLDEFIESSKI